MDTDFFLIQRMKNGDNGAVESFVRKYYPKIFQYCLLHIRDREEAEDLTQETFLKFFQSFERYQHRGKCSAFLYAIASNNCRDYYRKAKEQYMEEVPEKAEVDRDMDTAEIRMEETAGRIPEQWSFGPKGGSVMEPFEKKIQDYTKTVREGCVRESAVMETVRRSTDAFELQEERTLTYTEFLYQQLHFIQKRWWVLQGIVLAFLLFILKDSDGMYTERVIGAGASFFMTLVIPELWKNRRSSSMEVEGATFYSLRQIYSARILLFAMADLVMFTLFYLAASWTAQLTLGMFIINFILPFNISCCICFSFLCSRKDETEYAAAAVCAAWAVVWLMILGQDWFYDRIAEPVWAGLLVCSFVYLVWCVRRTQKDCETIWEVNRSWN